MKTNLINTIKESVMNKIYEDARRKIEHDARIGKALLDTVINQKFYSSYRYNIQLENCHARYIYSSTNSSRKILLQDATSLILQSDNNESLEIVYDEFFSLIALLLDGKQDSRRIITKEQVSELRYIKRINQSEIFLKDYSSKEMLDGIFTELFHNFKNFYTAESK